VVAGAQCGCDMRDHGTAAAAAAAAAAAEWHGLSPHVHALRKLARQQHIDNPARESGLRAAQLGGTNVRST
jgi:hypothetical protein